MPEPAELELATWLRAAAGEYPDPAAVANRVLERHRSERGVRGIGWRRPLAALAALVLAAAAISYFAPAADVAIATAPATATILRSAGLGEVADRVSGLDDSATRDGLTVRLVGGYADAARTVVLVDLPAAAGARMASATLHDQFGRVYPQSASIVDVSAGHGAYVFSPLSAPADRLGARLTLDIPGERGKGWELHGILVQERQHSLLAPPPGGTLGTQAVGFSAVETVPRGVLVTLSFPGAAARDLVATMDDGSSKGRPALLLQLLTPAGALAPFMSESVQAPGGLGLRALWLVGPGDYTIVVDFKGQRLVRPLAVPRP